MPKKIKYLYEVRIQICEDYLSGKRSASQIAADLGLKKLSGAIWEWINMYQTHGPSALIPNHGYNSYTGEFKQSVIDEYYSQKTSFHDLAAKYKINLHTLSNWLSAYNENRQFVDYRYNPEVYMKESKRRTSFDERKEIVAYCLEHNRDISGTATIYEVSYSQVHSWIKKYEKSGMDGLVDRRGQHKSNEQIDETERLRRENLRLKRQLEEKDMVVELLKKVKEFERM